MILPAITVQIIDPKIIAKDEDDVRMLWLGGKNGKAGGGDMDPNDYCQNHSAHGMENTNYED